MSSMIQKPTKHLHKVLERPLYLKSSLVREFSLQIFLIWDKIKTFVGKFNLAIEGKLLSIADECNVWIGDHGMNCLLKLLATQTTVLIKPKGLNLNRVNSCMHLLFLRIRKHF